MSVLDKVIAAVTPPETQRARREAREKARSCATSGDWLQQALDQHVQIESAFAAVIESTAETERLATLRTLALVLTGHANAEESVLYPALALADEKGHATMGYSEQAAVKMQMGALEALPPMSQEFLDKIEHIRGAVAHHMYEEEGKWFLQLRARTTLADQSRLSARFREEYERYVGTLDGYLEEGGLILPSSTAAHADAGGLSM